MLFEADKIIWFFCALFSIWMLVLSVAFYRLYSHYRHLTEGVTKKDLQSILEELLKEAGEQKQEIGKLIGQLEKIEKDGFFYLQRVGLVRFNPFAETGGDQSFCLALLDGNDDGLVISSLHSRDTTRLYAKPIGKGKEAGYILSEEEKKAIINAKKIKRSSRA
ncbi:MAG TPA: DUF4446 family protein [Candidatus Bathyarchaeia archaeon]|nr:DUF4446 family protein [Candidatus Bathyarchaeia archaeon]